jgi:Uma2 family endonuclease
MLQAKTSQTLPAPPATPDAAHLQPYRFTTDDVRAMVDAGIIERTARLELIHGHLATMSPIGDAHLLCINRLNRLFVERADEDTTVSVQNPLRIDDQNAPEPDLLLCEGRDRIPTPDNTYLVIEVADSSLQYDRRVKTPLYATAGIPEVWIVNLEAGYLEVYGDWDDGTYKTTRIVMPDETVAVTPCPNMEPLPVSDLLPPSGTPSDEPADEAAADESTADESTADETAADGA